MEKLVQKDEFKEALQEFSELKKQRLGLKTAIDEIKELEKAERKCEKRLLELVSEEVSEYPAEIEGEQGTIEVHSRVPKKLITPKMWEEAVAEVVPEKKDEIKDMVVGIHAQTSVDTEAVLEIKNFTFKKSGQT